MAQKIHSAQIGDREEIAANGTYKFKWNNPPGIIVNYFAVASPSTPSGPHGTSSCKVGVVSVRHTKTKDNYNGESDFVEIDIKNYGNAKAGFTLWQTWVTN